jgi:hypothetical protein
MQLFGGSFITTAMLAALAYANAVTNVFRSIDSVTPESLPYWYTTVSVGWVLDSASVQTGDTFSLTMPDVFIARANSAEWYLPYFDMESSDGTIVASCSISTAGGISSSTDTVFSCVVTADFCKQPVYSGSLEIIVTFDAGGRVETIANANLWTVNTNTMTFNGDLSFDVTFASSGNTAGNLWYERSMNPDREFIYYLPYQSCGSSDTTSHTIVFQLTGQLVFEPSTVEAYGATAFNPYGFPLDAVSVGASITYSSDMRTMTVIFGPTTPDVRVWLSFYAQDVFFSETADFMITQDTQVCADGSVSNGGDPSYSYEIDLLATFSESRRFLPPKYFH